MDVQYIGLAVAGFGVAVACLLLFFKFGIKEKSYEEALAEQRQYSNALLGARPKPKEKKVKKAKKSKEKQQPSAGAEQEKSEESDAVSEANSTASKPHVEFNKEPEVIVPEKDLPPAPANKKRTKKEKVKPILINKELVEKNALPPPTVETPSANHFERLHPKDEFELLHSHIKDGQKQEKQTKTKDDVKQEKANKKEEQPKQEQPVKEKPTKKSAEHKKTVEPEPVKNTKKAEQEPKQQNKKVVEVVSNKKNVKQVEAKQLQPVVEEVSVKEEAVESAVALSKTNGIVVNGGKEKKKKKSDFNALQQLAGDKQAVNLTILLNLVRKAELSRSEVQILIDLLLNKQHEAPTIADWSEGKSDPVQKLKKQLAEKERLVQEEQEALTGAQNKLREIRAEQNAEKSQFNQKIRQLEEALQNKQIEIQAINGRLLTQTQKMQQLQAQLNEEMLNSRKIREEHNALLAQRKQMECRLAQAQEADAVVAQLRNDVQELTSQNNQLSVDLHQSRAENDGHQTYIAQLKQQIATYQQDLGKLQKDLEQSSEFARQQEQARMIAERHVDMGRVQVSEVEGELAKVKGLYQNSKEDVRRFEMAETKAREDLVHLTQQKEDVERLVGKLKKELSEARTEIQNLQQQQTNGTIEQNKLHQVERLNLQNEITSLRSQLQQAETKHAQEVQTVRNTIINLEASLAEQKNKNDELRKKNWKVMEALNAAESRQCKVNVNDAVTKARFEEQQVNRRFIQRLFPEVQVLGEIPQTQWLEEVEKLIRNHLKKKEKVVSKAETSSDVAKLQAQIVTYKTIIDDTEGMLNKLQQHIEQQEMNWRNQLKAKEGEIENLRENTLNKLQKTVTTLEIELSSEKEGRRLLQQQLESLKSNKAAQNDSTVMIERLSEEVDRLRVQLQEKQNGNVHGLIQQENSLPKSQTLPSTNGPALLQHHFSYSSSADSSLTEVTIKPKNKKKKKKGNGN